MSEQNKALVRRFFEEVWNQQNVDAMDELVSVDFVGHDPQAPATGREAANAVVRMFLTAFPTSTSRSRTRSRRQIWWRRAGRRLAPIEAI